MMESAPAVREHPGAWPTPLGVPTMTDRTCTAEGCEKQRASRWRCADHYAGAQRTCSVEGCGRKHYGKGLCKSHWSRRWRASREPCSIEGCEHPRRTRGWCITHYGRWRRNGDPNVVLPGFGGDPTKWGRSGEHHPAWRGDEASYSAIHKRLASVRGSARTHVCFRCGEPADEWAYDHQDADEKVGESNGVEVRYSTDLERYQPACVDCHRQMDSPRAVS